MKKTVIIGGGLAGIGAGITLLENTKGADVTLYNMGHHLGGRASSWRDSKGFNIDHGFHALFASYHHLRKMLKHAGVSEKKVFVSNSYIDYFYEEFGKNIFCAAPNLKSHYPSYPFSMYRKLVHFGAKNAKTFFHNNDIEQYDDICYTAWALEHGFPKELTDMRWFRFSQDALFNWPNEVSAYITMKGMRAMGKSNYFLINGNYGENIIKPLTDYFVKLGGKIEIRKKLVEVIHDGQKATGIKIGIPDARPHEFGMKPWKDAVPVLQDTIEEIKNIDSLILAIPTDCFKELNHGDAFFWNGFKSIENLRTVASLSYQVWTKEPVMPAGCISINGLDEPMGTVADYKTVSDEYRNNPEIGSALEWVGQETSFENKTNEELKELIFNSFLKIPGAKDPRKAGIIHESFNRNKANYERYLLTEPGTVKFRPRTRTHFKNLFLAGDWIRNDVEMPCMEGAALSGINAAHETIKYFSKNS